MFTAKFLSRTGLILAVMILGLTSTAGPAEARPRFRCPDKEFCFYSKSLYKGRVAGGIGFPGRCVKKLPFTAKSAQNRSRQIVVLWSKPNCLGRSLTLYPGWGRTSSLSAKSTSG
ncbi:peptidase inhibitor family I36 protein [Streptomyces sp. I05A-00742]|uniref:peptidase inhibitor family I36 protein n=1 Tax=Streptomyces sp. I05A-00742 TaxID=2732853 RepID=UPI001488960B|nr:peptidase inhibitor family I36 protein [Streptomyces sp. I05A-00742]